MPRSAGVCVIMGNWTNSQARRLSDIILTVIILVHQANGTLHTKFVGGQAIVAHGARLTQVRARPQPPAQRLRSF
jgi:hypothetical protein